MTSFTIRGKFTLIELILVIGIMGVLMGITIPSFSKMMKSGGVASSGRNIIAKINATRSYATMKRNYVALVFPGPGDTDAQIPQKLRNTSFRPALIYYDGTNYNFIRWIEGEPWDNLPAGTVFNNTTAPNDNNHLAGAQTVQNCDFSDVVNATAIANLSNCLIYNSDGSLAGGSGAFQIGIYEATSKGDGTSTVTNADNYMKLSVNPFTGKITTSTP